MSEPTPRPRKKRSSSRRPPPKPIWYEQPWVLYSLVGGCVVMILLLAFIWWKRHQNPEEQAVMSGGPVQETMRDLFKGDYTLAGPDRLVEKKALPAGLSESPNANELRSQWGPVRIMGANAQGATQPVYDHFLIIYDFVPQAACLQLTPQLTGGEYERVWITSSAPVPTPDQEVHSTADITRLCGAAQYISVMALGK